MQNQLVDELKQIAKMRRIKNYENMSKEALLIVFLKSEQSLGKPYNNIEILMGSETDDIINELFESSLQKDQEKLEEKNER